ncbi:hypothetical protein [Streptomyces sp. NPDC029003]|uniref:hypothetical protein n=1 Tax=Streptomyces sp. NPDC029003 TaxID=3155125 RepID=UPI0033F9C005
MVPHDALGRWPEGPGFTTSAGWIVHLARHVTAAAVSRDPDHAVEGAREAATNATETRPVRVLRELVTLERAVCPWQDAPVGRDLAEILAPVNEGV